MKRSALTHSRAGTATSRPGRKRWRGAWPPLASAILAIAVYLPALDFGYVRDDHRLVQNNPALVNDVWLGKLLTADFWAFAGLRSGMWRPVVSASYAADARTGAGAAGFHATNIVLHALTSACIAAIAAQAGCSPLWAFAGGAWFAAAPAHAESVAWISGRTDILCGLFAALTIAIDRRVRRRGRVYPGVLASCAFACALLSKETAMTWVGVLAAASWVESDASHRGLRAQLRWLAPYLVVLTAYAIAHRQFTGPVQISSWLDASTARAQHLGAATVLPALLTALVPGARHIPDRLPDLPPQAGGPAVLLGAALTLGAVALLVWRWRHRAADTVPLAAFLFPTLGLAGLAAVTGYLTIADRNLYVPSIGVAWGLALALQRLTVNAATAVRRAWVVGAAALAAVSAVETVVALPPWRNDRLMYEAIARVQPQHASARVGLAYQLVLEGREGDAIEHLRAAEVAEPRNPIVAVTRARIASRRGDWVEQLAHARRAIELDSLRGDAWEQEGWALLRLGRFVEADSILARRWMHVPGNSSLASLRGRVLLMLGRVAEARPLLESAALQITDDPGLYTALGDAEFREQRLAEARGAYERAVHLAPETYEAWLRLAIVCVGTGDRAAADAALRHAEALPAAADGRAARLRHSIETQPAGP